MLINYIIIFMLIAPYFLLSVTEVRDLVVKKNINPVIFGGYIFSAFFLYVFNYIIDNRQFDFYGNTLVMVGYIFIPLILQMINKNGANRNLLLDCLTVLVIWLPFEYELLPSMNVNGLQLYLLIGILNLILIFVVINPLNIQRFHKASIKAKL